MNITLHGSEALTINEGWTLHLIDGVPILRNSEDDHEIVAWYYHDTLYTTSAMVLQLVKNGLADRHDAMNTLALDNNRLINEAISALIAWEQNRSERNLSDFLDSDFYPQAVLRWQIPQHTNDPIFDANGNAADWKMQ
jgi:hypothetical protein